MKRVEVKLNLDAVAPLLDVIKAAADGLAPRLAIDAQVPAHDAELAEGWRRELLQSQGGDIAVLLALFDTDFFITGAIAFDSTNCEPILRACSALRLRLRETSLSGLGDEGLESGAVAMEEMPEAQRRAFAAYVFLATLQEVLVQHLDPTVMEG